MFPTYTMTLWASTIDPTHRACSLIGNAGEESSVWLFAFGQRTRRIRMLGLGQLLLFAVQIMSGCVAARYAGDSW